MYTRILEQDDQHSFQIYDETARAYLHDSVGAKKRVAYKILRTLLQPIIPSNWTSHSNLPRKMVKAAHLKEVCLPDKNPLSNCTRLVECMPLLSDWTQANWDYKRGNFKRMNHIDTADNCNWNHQETSCTWIKWTSSTSKWTSSVPSTMGMNEHSLRYLLVT